MYETFCSYEDEALVHILSNGNYTFTTAYCGYMARGALEYLHHDEFRPTCLRCIAYHATMLRAAYASRS